MVNKVTLIGRVGKDPEVRRLDNGTAVAKFSLATSEKWKDSNGEKQETTEWHNVVVWRGLAEVAEKYVKKGDLLYLEGKVTYREYTGNDNQKKYFTEIVASNFQMLGGKGDGQQSGGYFPAEEPKGQQKAPATVEGDDPTSDLPF